MTELSERIEACIGDTTELAAEMLTFVTGDDVFEAGGMLVHKPTQETIATHANPLTDLNAIAALEREYGKLPLQIQISHNNLAAVMWEHGSRRDWTTAPTEALARSAALVRALEVSRD